eukprot:gene21335-27365_t
MIRRLCASVLTIHGRTRDEKGQLVRDCDWEMIGRIKKHFSERAIPVPIIANGGIENLDDVYKCIAATGCDGVMSSEAILENPALFSQSLTRSGVYKNQIDLTEDYLHYAEQYPVWHMKCIRSHVMKMLYRYIAKHPDELRDLCGMSHTIPAFFEVCRLARELVTNSLLANGTASDVPQDSEAYSASVRTAEDAEYSVSWYRRYSRQTDEVTGGVSIDVEGKVKKDRLLDLKTSFLRSTKDGTPDPDD